MYHKIIGGIADRKQRNIKNAVNYLLRISKPEEQIHVKTLSMTSQQDLLNFNNFILPKSKKSPYVCGVLSFEEENINEDLKVKIMSDFEEMLFSGIELTNRPPLMWVQHTDKDRLELNYLTFNALADGRSFTAYFDKTDRKLFNTFSEIINYENDFSSPLEKLDKRNTLINKPNPQVPKDKKLLIENLNNEIMGKIMIGELVDRNEVIKYIESIGYKINRVRKNAISIKLENDDKPIVLKGDIYEEGRIYADYRREPEVSNRRDPEVVKSALNQFRDDFERLLSKRQDKHRKRFKSSQRSIEKSIESRVNSQDLDQNFEFQNSFGIGGVTFSKSNLYHDINHNNNFKIEEENSELYIGTYKRKEKTEAERFELLRNRILEAKRVQKSIDHGIERFRDQQHRIRDSIRTTQFRNGFVRGYVARFSELFNEILRRAFSFSLRAKTLEERKEKAKILQKEKASELKSSGRKFRVRY